MNKLYQRNLLKEKLQDYILNFVYNHKEYQQLIFTGGTCLRKIYNLPRLSEDLDFDFSFDFSINMFANDLEKYLTSKEGFKNIELKIANNNKTLFVKFLQENKEKIFVRCDFSPAPEKVSTEINPYYGEKFTLYILSYDLPFMFTNKLEAFLQRDFFKGSAQTVSFKGRDLFDIVWFLQQSAKSGMQIKPDWQKLEKDLGLSKDDILKKILNKVKQIQPKDVALDLAAFVESPTELDGFLKSYQSVIEKKLILLT